MPTDELHDALADLARRADGAYPVDRLARVRRRARRHAQLRATAVAALVLVVAAVGVGASLQLDLASDAPPATSDSPTPTPTPTETTTSPSEAPTSTPPPDSTTRAVIVNTPIEAAQAYVANVGGGTDGIYRVQVQQGRFALVDINDPAGPGSFVIEKVIGDAWTVIFAGQDTPPKSVIDRYQIPAAIWCPGGGCGMP
jgi:hypothetical protein